jgi:hypothetical protein
MAHRNTSKRSKARSMLRLAALEQSKNAVFSRSARPVRKNHTATPSTNSSGSTVPNYDWHLTGRVMLRYRFFVEQKNLAHSTIIVRLAAVRRLAYEASDTGLLSPDSAAGIRRVKGCSVGNQLV